MKAKILFVMSLVSLMFGCDRKQDTASRTIDSLKTELQSNHYITEQMMEVGALIDSIDANRNVLHTHMVEGTSYDNYVERMKDINRYVRKTETKLGALEKTVGDRKTNAAYASAIKKLRSELDIRNHELAALTEQVKLYKNENENLINTVSLQKAELQDKLNQIQANQEETAKLEEQVKQLLVKSKLDEGESYFARAAAVEETANRTKFAPRKKKNSMKQALELYKLAQFYGKDEAEAKVVQLEKKLGTTTQL